MRIWVDLDNSPHVLFFAPIVKTLRARGHEVWLSARDHAQTLELCGTMGIEVERIPGHGGRNKLKKVTSLFIRAIRCRIYAKSINADLAVSHGSRALTLAAWSLGIPVVTIYDYEPASYGLFNLLSRRILAPKLIPAGVLEQHGLNLNKLRQYDGVKEEVYLAGAAPTKSYRKAYQIRNHEILVVLRPPAVDAHYHVPDTDRLYASAVRHLARRDDVVIVFLPRAKRQIDDLHRLMTAKRPRVVVPESAIDGPSLLAEADLLVGAGGTMNREAALMRTPVYSLFAGEQGAIDKHFVETGRMVRIRSEKDVEAIDVRLKSRRADAVSSRPELIEHICSEILAVA